MGKFFKTSEYNKNPMLKDTLKTFNDYMSNNERYNYFDTYEIIVNNFIDGKRVFNRPFGFVQTNNDSLYKLPEYTGDIETDYKNITDYLENLDECFNELIEDNYFGTIKHSYKEHQYFKKENSKLVFNKKLLEDIYDRKLNFDQQTNTEKINNLINDKNTNLYEAFKSFKQTHTMAQKREKPKWYEFKKRFRNWKEEKSLNKLEKMLKNKGVKDEIINNAKNGATITVDDFNRSFGINEKTFTDSLDKMINSYKKNVNLRKEEQKEKKNILKFLDIVDEYKKLEQHHDLNSKDNKKEEDLLKESRINISKLMKFNESKNQEFYKEIFHKDFNLNDINIIRDNIIKLDEDSVDCYQKFISDIDEIADDIDFNNSSKLINIEDELFESVNNSKTEEEDLEEELVEEKINSII